MRLLKFLGATLLLTAATALQVAGGAALIFGQWAALFGAIHTSEILPGLALIVGGLLLSTVLIALTIKLLVTEREWNWQWSLLGMLPIVSLGWHYGAFTLALLIGSAMAFTVRRKVKQARIAPEMR